MVLVSLGKLLYSGFYFTSTNGGDVSQVPQGINEKNLLLCLLKNRIYWVLSTHDHSYSFFKSECLSDALPELFYYYLQKILHSQTTLKLEAGSTDTSAYIFFQSPVW